MKTRLPRFTAPALVVGAMLFSSLSFAEGPTLTPVPDPTFNGPVKVTPQPAPTAKAVSCKTAKVADVYHVYQLVNHCGDRVSNTFLRGGLINRMNSCNKESVLAEVYAAPCTCENCESESKVQAIRCSRGDCNVCENDEYVKALVMDLAASSHRVRKAATKSLRICGFRVESRRECVSTDVPSSILY